MAKCTGGDCNGGGPESHSSQELWQAGVPNQVWTWDITWLPSTVKGRWFYLYLVEDLYS
ncbi:hypothetical protein JJO56_19400 [Dickeya chrysanthemi]|nr:hypothetical protein [Dickeya chrysanthemi]